MRLLLAALLVGISAIAGADDFDALYREAGSAYGIDWRLVKAVSIVESNQNPKAENRRDPSVGLMQIHCIEAALGACKNRFDIEGWPGITHKKLLDPRINVHLGAQILAWNIRTYGLRKGIAVYNQWGARHTQNGEPFPNQNYIDKVLHAYHPERKLK